MELGSVDEKGIYINTDQKEIFQPVKSQRKRALIWSCSTFEASARSVE